jgi:urease subunit gamma
VSTLPPAKSYPISGPNALGRQSATAFRSSDAVKLSSIDDAEVSVVNLTPHEQDKLLVSLAAMVAKDRRARGLRLNHPEAVAILASFVLEGARDGRTVTDLMAAGREVLGRDDVLDGIPELITELQVEATFQDGTKLVTLHQPIP